MTGNVTGDLSRDGGTTTAISGEIDGDATISGGTGSTTIGAGVTGDLLVSDGTTTAITGDVGGDATISGGTVISIQESSPGVGGNLLGSLTMSAGSGSVSIDGDVDSGVGTQAVTQSDADLTVGGDVSGDFSRDSGTTTAIGGGIDGDATISGGTGSTTIGAGVTGNLDVSGGDTTTVTGDVGGDATISGGTTTISGGTTTTVTGVIGGDAVVSSGELDAGSAINNNLIVSGGQATINQSTGVLGYADISGGLTAISDDLTVAQTLNSSGGDFAVSGGTTTISGVSTLAGTGTVSAVGAASTLDFATDVSTAADATLSVTGGAAINLATSLSSSGDSLVVLDSGVLLEAPGGITMDGNSQLDASGAGSATVGGTYTNNSSAAVLGGTGADSLIFTGDVWGISSYANKVRFEGSLNPGNSPGTTTITGDAILAASNDLNIEIASDTASPVEGVDYDQVVVDGGAATLTLGGNLNVTIFDGYAPGVGTTYDIVTTQTGGTIIGDFATENLPIISGSLDWQINYDAPGAAGNLYQLEIVQFDPSSSLGGNLEKQHQGILGALARRRPI
jgi:hypothetical protein